MTAIEVLRRSPSFELDTPFEDQYCIPILPCDPKHKLKRIREEFFTGTALVRRAKLARQRPLSATESTLSLSSGNIFNGDLPITTTPSEVSSYTVANPFKNELFKSVIDLRHTILKQPALCKKTFYHSLQNISTEWAQLKPVSPARNLHARGATFTADANGHVGSPGEFDDPLQTVSKPMLFDLEFDEDKRVPRPPRVAKQKHVSICDSGIGVDDDIRSLSRGSIFTLSDEDELPSANSFCEEQPEVLCGSRVSQMTRTYNDIEAVTRLLQEKENDLELAARIGQQLLARNRVLEDKVTCLENEVTHSNEQITQLRHDLQMKTDLLQIYTNDVDESSVESTPTGLRHFNVDILQRRVHSLESENKDLRTEAGQLALDTQDCEDMEKKLVDDVIKQLGDANHDVSHLSDELAKKVEESLRQQDELTQLYAQVADFQATNKRYCHENAELAAMLGVTRECQNELTTELAGLKDKYSEVLDLLHDTQEQLRRAHKKNAPGSRGSSHLGNMFSSLQGNGDSIANELHSLTYSQGEEEASDGARRVSRVFDTVKLSSRHVDCTPTRVPNAHLTTSLHTTDSRGSPYMSSSHCSSSGLPSLDSGADSDASLFTDSDDFYGRNRLAADVDRLRHSLPYGCRTPDSIMSTGSGRMSSSSAGDWKMPQKLQIVKPIEGSVTLHQWSRLATPHLGGLLEDRDGVAVKVSSNKTGATHCNLNLEVYSMSDLEEDEEDMDKGFPGKQFMHTSGIYTYTNSTVLHPDEVTNLTSSLQPSQTSAIPSSNSGSLPSAPATPSRRGSTSTFSTNFGLAKHLHERGLADDSMATTATPANSPQNSGPHSPEAYSYKLPGIDDITKKLHLGASFLRRTLYGPSPAPSVVHKMNLIEKVQAIGVDNLVKQKAQSELLQHAGVSHPETPLGTPTRPGTGLLNSKLHELSAVKRPTTLSTSPT